MFFLALSFAAMSSLIAMIEMATRMFLDLGVRRTTAVSLVGVLGFVLGLPSAWKMGFLENQDWVWGLGLLSFWTIHRPHRHAIRRRPF